MFIKSLGKLPILGKLFSGIKLGGHTGKACRCATSACLLVLLSPLSFHLLHVSSAWLHFSFSFYLHSTSPSNSIRPLVHNRLSVCCSTLTSTNGLESNFRLDTPGLVTEVTDGALGREGKPELNKQEFPLASIVNSIYINWAVVAPHQLKMFLSNKMH